VATERNTFPREKCLPDLLWEQASVHPDRVAVVAGAERLSFRLLAERSAAVAGYLRRHGVLPDDCVGIFLDPSIDLMVGVWGVLCSGGAYLPLSPEYPEERLRFMVEDSRAKVILTQGDLAGRAAELAPPGTRIVTIADAEGSGRDTARMRHTADSGPCPGNLAYVIYTSGSTGKPKGIMIEHRGIVNQMRWLRTAYSLDHNRTVLQKTPLSFDAAQWEILAPGCGSRVVMASPGSYRDPERLVDLITGHAVTTLQCVPTLLQALVDTGELPRCGTLTQVFSGGEALSRSLAVRFFAALPDCQLVNLYGPSECTINSSACTVDRGTVHDGPLTISIGTPVDNTRYHILGADRSPVTAGETGELHISGAQLARGYLHRPGLTAERFIDNPFSADYQHARLYRTGDLASWNADGTVQFVGRSDNQVKLRGFRVELDEIRAAIEAHGWVRRAAVVVRDDPRTGFQHLVAFAELNPKEAALMDQGNHGAHHQTKESRLQTRAQLSNGGCRDRDEIAGRPCIDLPGRIPTPDQRRVVFARKTYRFFDGGDVTADRVRGLLAGEVTGTGAEPREPGTLSPAELGEILRYFGQYLSDDRLLPKYGYASPGALYATQMYLDVDGVGGVEPGCYYYHPVHHQLVLIRRRQPKPGGPRMRVHFLGKRRAIEPVYRNNIREVLEIEAGHMVGLFDRVLPAYGLAIRAHGYLSEVKDDLDCADEDHYLGTFDVVAGAAERPADDVDVYLQAHPGRVADLPAGLYRYQDGHLRPVSADLVQKRHVIAINQRVYERSSLGVTIVSRARDEWLHYLGLGRKLQHLQMNDLGFGFMSSGYSSKSGNDLASAERIAGILGRRHPSYFAVGGLVSAEQRAGEGMAEDIVHMKGPAELIRDDLAGLLPDYMIPNRVVLLDALPLTANGKVDVQALRARDDAAAAHADRPFVPPRTPTEERIARLWTEAMKHEAVSMHDDFFACGGNSLIAVGLINSINRRLGTALPLQVLFEHPTVERLARRVDADAAEPCSRLVPLHAAGSRAPVYCWPGLGGYAMNLKLLADRVRLDRPVFGLQAYGVNPGEQPYATIGRMAAEDVELIRRHQPAGPYTLWGYSFGARVAFEAAYQLERAGERVENLFLIAPGQPPTGARDRSRGGREPEYDDDAYVSILFSVFAGGLTDPALAECLAVAKDDASFAAFVGERFPRLDRDLIGRIVRVVRRTFQFEYAFHELARRRVTAPVTIFKARGDDYSFVEKASGYSSAAPTVVDIEADHYGLIRESGIEKLADAVRRRLRTETEERPMPHVNIKHFPVPLTGEQRTVLVTAITDAVRNAFDCDENVISIALEPVAKEQWNERVYVPEVVDRKELLCKTPNY